MSRISFKYFLFRVFCNFSIHIRHDIEYLIRRHGLRGAGIGLRRSDSVPMLQVHVRAAGEFSAR